jgi:NAD(P)-dependent dehydrogenase (short-subunit alcohol dehydrogenase family)
MAKTAIIVGASRGLGLGLAREFARRGWQVTAMARSAARRDPAC